MKRLLSVLLVLTILLAFSACGNSNETPSTTTTESAISSQTESSKTESGLPSVKKPSSSKQTTTTKTTAASTKVSSEPTIEDQPTYENLSCRTEHSITWRTVQIKHGSTGMSLSVNIPNDWQLSPSGKNTFNILRAGKNIGVITTEDLPKASAEYESLDKFRIYLEAYTQIKRYTEKGKDTYYRCFQFECYEGSESFFLNMRILYMELDDGAVSNMLDSATTILKENPFVPLSQTNGSKEILILGNSFISTSQIGSFLNDMLSSSNSEYRVNAVSIGMASVETFAKDTEICNEIASGRYCYVFICGFYSTYVVGQLVSIIDVCAASGTSLVVFPAHNESQSAIEDAVRTYRNNRFLNWKGEIDALIESGISYNDFCVNDYHKHSTPLAGYVGAHMIYRTLFGSPPALTASAPLTNQYVNSKLGEYITSGGEIKGSKDNLYTIY